MRRCLLRAVRVERQHGDPGRTCRRAARPRRTRRRRRRVARRRTGRRRTGRRGRRGHGTRPGRNRAAGPGLPPGPDRHEPARPPADPAEPPRAGPARPSCRPARRSGVRGAPAGCVGPRDPSGVGATRRPWRSAMRRRRELRRLPRRLVAGARRARDGPPHSPSGRSRGRDLLLSASRPTSSQTPASEPDRYSGTKAPAPSRAASRPYRRDQTPSAAAMARFAGCASVRRQVEHDVRPARARRRIEGRRGRRESAGGRPAPAPPSVGRYTAAGRPGQPARPRPSRRGRRAGCTGPRRHRLDGGARRPGRSRGRRRRAPRGRRRRRRRGADRHWRLRTTSST